MIETEEKATRAETQQCEILAFCCNFCAYAAADLAGARRMQYPANVRIVHVPCTGKVEVQQILAAFERGIDGVLVAGCLEGGCHFVEGNLRARRRAEAAQRILDEIGLGAGAPAHGESIGLGGAHLRGARAGDGGDGGAAWSQPASQTPSGE